MTMRADLLKGDSFHWNGFTRIYWAVQVLFFHRLGSGVRFIQIPLCWALQRRVSTILHLRQTNNSKIFFLKRILHFNIALPKPCNEPRACCFLPFLNHLTIKNIFEFLCSRQLSKTVSPPHLLPKPAIK